MVQNGQLNLQNGPKLFHKMTAVGATAVGVTAVRNSFAIILLVFLVFQVFPGLYVFINEI